MHSTPLHEDGPDKDPSGSFILILDFLESCRKAGSPVRVRDMEPALKRMGLHVGGKDHFILLMADWESANEAGFPRSAMELVEEYPEWTRDILEHVSTMQLVADVAARRHRRCSGPGGWRRPHFQPFIQPFTRRRGTA